MVVKLSNFRCDFSDLPSLEAIPVVKNSAMLLLKLPQLGVDVKRTPEVGLERQKEFGKFWECWIISKLAKLDSVNNMVQWSVVYVNAHPKAGQNTFCYRWPFLLILDRFGDFSSRTRKKVGKAINHHILGDVGNSAQEVVMTGPPFFTTSFRRNIKLKEFIWM